jgi:hypothetical protein
MVYPARSLMSALRATSWVVVDCGLGSDGCDGAL